MISITAPIPYKTHPKMRGLFLSIAKTSKTSWLAPFLRKIWPEEVKSVLNKTRTTARDFVSMRNRIHILAETVIYMEVL